MNSHNPHVLVGIDMVVLRRFHWLYIHGGSSFLNHVFTDREQMAYHDQWRRLATRFAAKEAIAKLLGTGLSHMHAGGVPMNHIEILSERDGGPVVNLYGRAKQVATGIGLQEICVSLSITSTYAAALAVAA